MGFFSKLFAKDPDADPFMPGKVVVVGGFGTGRIQSVEVVRNFEVFVVRMDTLPPKRASLYVNTDGTGFPMRVPVGAAEAELLFARLKPKEESSDWRELAQAFSDVRQSSTNPAELQRLLGHLYASVELAKVEQRKMLEWVEDALYSELSLTLGRTREDLRAEVRKRFQLPDVTPRTVAAASLLPEPPLLNGLAPIGSFAVTQKLAVCDPLVVLEWQELDAKIASGEIPPVAAEEQTAPVLMALEGRKGTWHAYVRREQGEIATALIVTHSSCRADSAVQRREAGLISLDSEFVGVFDHPVVFDREFVGEEIEFSHENFPRVTDGRGVAVDSAVPREYPVVVGEEGGEVVYVEIPLDDEHEAAEGEEG